MAEAVRWSRRVSLLAGTIAIAAAAWLLMGVLVLAPKKPGYRHWRHTISELGEVGAPHQRLTAFGVFLPVAALMLAAALLLLPDSGQAAALALCIAVGYAVAAVFPCDPGSPVSGTARQGMHNLGGAVEYIGGGLALLALAAAERAGSAGGEGAPGHWAGVAGMVFTAAGIAVLATAGALTVLPSAYARGAVQRVGELCLFGGVAWAALALRAAERA